MEIEKIAKLILAPGKGILAADESTGTMTKRLDAVGIPSTPQNRLTFREMMFTSNEAKKYIEKTNSKCQLSTYHLVTDNKKMAYEIEEYKKNVVSNTNTLAYIWKMHNWSGNYENKNFRKKTARKSCGRPNAPELTIRAGGAPGRTAAIVPCCQTLGPPNEEKSILGHLDSQSFEEVYFGEKFNELRDAHNKKEFDKIDYCKDCDFLYDDPEILVWSNDKKAKVHHMLGTDDDFILTNYAK